LIKQKEADMSEIELPNENRNRNSFYK